MSVKQDRTHTRTAEDLERKYNLGIAIAEAKQVADEARRTAANLGNQLANAVTKDYVDTNFAPAGFGLGGDGKYSEDLDVATNNGWYWWTSNANNKPFDYGTLLVLRRGTRVTQLGFDPIMCGHGGIVVRHYTGSQWSAWEWTNPPLLANTEYRTTERYLGKVVYTKLLVIDALPNAKSQAYSTGVAATNIVRQENLIYFASGNVSESPYFLADGSILVKHLFTGNLLEITTTSDYSTAMGRFQIWYTKD